ncbi:ClpX C4-type zinc finger protein, partial [Bifidobacterium adolescentis]
MFSKRQICETKRLRMGRVVSYNDAVPRCTFCGKSESQVRKLVTGS